jgi:hypothetical protein
MISSMNAKSKLIRIPLGFLVLALGALAGMAVTTPAFGAVLSHRATSTATFTLARDAKIHFGANTMASLSALSVGEVAHISYTVENGVWLAHRVAVNPAHHQHHNSTSTHPHVTKTHELHAHGKILSYDVSAGTISISFRR